MLIRLAGRWGFVTALAAFGIALIAAAPPQGDRQARRVAQLIDKLGDDDFDARQQAERELTRIGKPAAERLFRAALTSEDLEIRKRAAKIIAVVDPGAFVRLRRATRVRAVTREIAKMQHGTDATTWGESIANPFTALTEEGKKKLRAQGVEIDRLLKMRARLITGNSLNKIFVNRDPDVILVFGKGFIVFAPIYSVGPVLAVEDAHFMGDIQGASLVWCVDESFPRGQTSGMPLVLAPSVQVNQMSKVDDEVLRGDYGWKAPKDLCKPLLEATKNDPPMTEELAAERNRSTALIRKAKGIDVKDHAKPIANPFTTLTDEGKKKLKARGVDVDRLVGLKKALYLSGDHGSKKAPFINADKDVVLVLGKGFRTSNSIYSMGPILAVDDAHITSRVTGADLVWFVEQSKPWGVTTGVPVVLQPTVLRFATSEDSKHVWHGDYGWRRPKNWPAVQAK